MRQIVVSSIRTYVNLSKHSIYVCFGGTERGRCIAFNLPSIQSNVGRFPGAFQHFSMISHKGSGTRTGISCLSISTTISWSRGSRSMMAVSVRWGLYSRVAYGSLVVYSWRYMIYQHRNREIYMQPYLVTKSSESKDIRFCSWSFFLVQNAVFIRRKLLWCSKESCSKGSELSTVGILDHR